MIGICIIYLELIYMIRKVSLTIFILFPMFVSDIYLNKNEESREPMLLVLRLFSE